VRNLRRSPQRSYGTNCSDSYKAKHTPIYLVIDAIDEAIQDERDEIFKALEKLISFSPSVRIFITGRPDEDVLGWFEMSSGV
jgi:restriction endonuclease